MPSPKVNPAIAVIRYFETANVDAAKVTLALAQSILRTRLPKPPSPKPTKPAKAESTS